MKYVSGVLLLAYLYYNRSNTKSNKPSEVKPFRMYSKYIAEMYESRIN